MRSRAWAALALTAGVGIVACRAGSAEPAGTTSPWRGWDRYQVLMWSTGAPRDMSTWIARLKELGCTGEELGRGGDPSPYTGNQFGYYVENLVNGLGFLNNRKSIYDEDFRGYTTTRDKKILVRKPCFDDPAFWQEQERTLPALIRQYSGKQPLLYNLRDELSVGSFASPMDYCFCPHTLTAFRGWLKEKYGSLDALNAEWDSHFASWDDVTPLTTYEIKDRERVALAGGRPENYAPWADHRDYMDHSFAQTLDRLRGMVHAIDPATPVGIEGTQMPSAWGGYDLWRLSQSIDWAEPYDIGSSREIFRSFLPAHAPVLGTVFGKDFSRIRLELWRLTLDGDRGCIVWDDEQSRSIRKDTPEMAVTERGQGLKPIFSEMRRVAPELMPLKRMESGIAIHYSQASIRAHWMFDSREDRDTWPRRFSSYEASHSRYARDRDSFVRLAEDAGVPYHFVAYEQLEKGQLSPERDRVLFLPQSVAMSRAECDAVRAYIRAGGTVIADNMTATMDEHCKRLPAGQLDDLFGIRRSRTGWRAEAEGDVLPARQPGAGPLHIFEPEIHLTTGKALRSEGKATAVIEARTGKGRTIYLNLDMHGYGRDRLQPGKAAETFGLMQRLLAEAGLASPVRVSRAGDGAAVPCVRVWRYQSPSGEYLAVMRNPEMAADSLGPVGYQGNAALEKPETVRIRLPFRGHVRDVRTGKDLGENEQVEGVLDPWSPLIYRIRKQ